MTMYLSNNKLLTEKAELGYLKINSFDTISALTFLAFQNLKALAKVERKADNLNKH